MRALLIATPLLLAVAGCASTGEAGKPTVADSLAARTPEQHRERDRKLREMMATFIARHRVFSNDNLLLGRREYSKALVSGPFVGRNIIGSPVEQYCVKFNVANLSILGSGDGVFTFNIVSDQPRLTIAGDRVFGEPPCTTPYVPFPELEAKNLPPRRPSQPFAPPIRSPN